ncbi:RdRP-domain-containing protein [Parathielavia hyrcaniae]|uniref:RNA-dependent RNA polymerase n=1 Tax=Parathielavia hyrcaniae TaxID=113614 RepID=A0AAN6SX13_9PEZI|nr:RdRP-domain-containing protein [Parathielavia hyrcaniae]
MEVFMRNLPLWLTEDGLRNQLQPFMQQLSVTDYVAEKQRNKNFGHITFLRKTDGARFLQRHGQVPLPAPTVQARRHRYPPTQARLQLLGNNVYCKLSDREPDEFALRSLQHQLEASQHSHDEAAAEPTKTLEATELSCGYHAFNDGRLTFQAEWLARERCLVKFARRSLLITLTGRRVKLRIPYHSVVELVWWHDGSAAITLSWAPVILTSQTSQDGDLAPALGHLTLTGTQRGRDNQRQRIEAIDRDHAAIAQCCLVYYVRFPNAITRHTRSDFQAEMSRLCQRELFFVTRYHVGFQYASGTMFHVAWAHLRAQLAKYNTAGDLPYGILFLLQALVANGYLHPSTVSALAQRLVRLFTEAEAAGNDKPPVSVDAFKKLFEWIDYPTPHGDPGMYEVDGIMESLEEAERLERQSAPLRSELLGDQSRAYVFRAVVTPTRITLHGPELEPMNRVLRKFPNHTSYFVRAQFCDEDGQDLFFLNTKISLDAICERFKSVLTNGIQVAGRVYKLLGFSHSSLRAHSAWLSAPFVHKGQVQVPDFIITGLGDFKNIKSPARRAARIGQAFSDTPYAVDLDKNMVQVLRIQDVERNGRVFSDGVGAISRDAAEAVYDVIPRSKGFPTAFQIRWAGAKGMLAVDPRLEGRKICVRSSMLKFESNDRQLEICDLASKPVPLVLNRQLIKILEDMGAPDDWFLDLQRREVQRLRGITATVFNTASFLGVQRVGEKMQLHKFLRQTEVMGIDYRRDNFLRGAVEAILLGELRLLKDRARIPVRQGMTLFGIMDETGFLKEGEVHVTYDAADRHCEPPGPGRVVVTRSPALHPGDVQLACNVTPPDGHPLTNHRNSVVFSMWGNRDLPSQLSGGDLDGDLYHVIWDPDVLGTLRAFAPADYARIPPLELDKPVETADMAAFFVDFMGMDHLGVVATRHKILADQRGGGTLDPDCIKLAELASAAVDFSKTGRKVDMSQPELRKAPRWRPDFLAKGPNITIHDRSAIELDAYTAPQSNDDDEDEDRPQHRYYRSDKILGRLYRAVDEHEIWTGDIRMVIASGDGPSFWDQFLTAVKERVSAIGPVEWQHRADEAHRIRHAYEDALHGVMIDCAEHPHQPLRELEVFVGFIMNKTGVQSNRQRDRSVKLKDEFERITAWITKEMRNPSSASGYSSEVDALELCLACLYTGCKKEYRAAHPGRRSSARDLESFKIVAAAALVRELGLLERGVAGQTYAYGGGMDKGASFRSDSVK